MGRAFARALSPLFRCPGFTVPSCPRRSRVELSGVSTREKGKSLRGADWVCGTFSKLCRIACRLLLGPYSPMSCNEVLKTRVSPEIKRQAKAIADREFLSEAAWLKRL